MNRAALRSLAIAAPSTVRTNDFWRTNHPELLESRAERALGKVFRVEGGPSTAFEAAMAPHLGDPFLGTVERRVLGPDEPVMALEVACATHALAAASCATDEVDLLIACAFPSDQPGIGNAAYLARALGLRGSAFNVESACSSALVALDVGGTLVAAGRHRRVLVVTSCVYSRVTRPDSSLSFTIGDAAAAFLIEPAREGEGILGAHTVHTAETCGALAYELAVEDGTAVMRMKTFPAAREALRDSAERTVVECCEGACRAAGVRLDDVAVFVCNSPTAWFADFFAAKLGVARERVVDTYPRYANVGPALWPTALHVAAREERLRPGDLVLAYSIGSVASAAAVVMRWGDVAIAN
jgi:3-oxoacyl-[acyl-carrier-protein] synthase-3